MTGVRVARLALIALCATTAIWLVLPTLVTFPVSFTAVPSFAIPERGLSTRWWVNLVTDQRWFNAMSVSVQVAALATIGATVIGTMAGLALDRHTFRGKRLVEIVLFTPAIVPLILLGLAIYYVFLRWQLAGTVLGLALGHTVLGIPLVLRPVAANLSRHDRIVEQAAASLGAAPIAVFRDVTLPLILPGVMAGAVFAFIGSFDEVVLAIFLSSAETQTLPVLMFNAVTRELDPTVAAAASLVLLVTTVLILAALRLGGKEAASRAF